MSLQKSGTQNSGFKGSIFNNQQLNSKFTSAIIPLVVLKLSTAFLTGEKRGPKMPHNFELSLCQRPLTLSGNNL